MAYRNVLISFLLILGHSPENDSIMQFLVSEGAVGEMDTILDQVGDFCRPFDM